ncbi:MAG: M20/M25/M40 family metallo-hydrolase, partial [Verrucomicrobia bacterium]|nr:M20/M25/M40 family metallo-hydrolase [Verrucomicrobiota bacterium]
MPKKPDTKAVLAAIRRRAKSPDFQKRMRDLLVELCRIDTTPNADVAVMRAAEDKTFGILERELGKMDFTGARAERRPINPAIKNHHHYSLLHFTKTPQRPDGLTPEQTYAGRGNLLYVIPGPGEGTGQNVAVNAHVDVVAPYFPPRVKGDIVFGRGSCDDKGSVVGIIGALQILSELMPAAGLRWKRNVVAMLVIEEETGGNGSLSLALDRDLKKLYDSILIGEITNLKLHPANRGAVWFRAELKAAGASLFEMAAFINEELEKEGAAIRAESRHDLFPQRPVQTCHGIIGSYGEHPSRICGEVSFAIRFDRGQDECGRGL